ncbi:PAS domain-containing protein [Abortiporus biennis]
MDTISHVSFIGIVDFTEDAHWVYASESVSDLLGFEPHELIGRPSLELVHPDEFPQVRGLHYSTIKQDQAAVIAYLRMRHKDPCKGYILCAITRTVCQNVLVGSVSFASPGPKAMHNNSTAQEVTIITPSAVENFELRRWGDRNPMPPCPLPNGFGSSNNIRRPPSPTPLHFDPLPQQSVRTALILDRFSEKCHILYCANDSIVDTTKVMGRSFFDFVAAKDEESVKSWIDLVKSWGVNERGQPSDGGFGFGKFTLCIRGRDSSSPPPDTHPRTRHSSISSHSFHTPRPLRESPPMSTRQHKTAPRPRATTNASEDIAVDAIFSAHSDGLMVILRYAT